jgi:hypothetical protein
MRPRTRAAGAEGVVGSAPLPAEIADLLQPEPTDFDVPEFVKPSRKRR